MKRREFVKTMTAAGTGLLLPRLSLHADEVQPDAHVKRVLGMFKCHFDAGFIDTQYNVVHKRYFDKFFPQAEHILRVIMAANCSGPGVVGHVAAAVHGIPSDLRHRELQRADVGPDRHGPEP